jgi:LemA protein
MTMHTPAIGRTADRTGSVSPRPLFTRRSAFFFPALLALLALIGAGLPGCQNYDELVEKDQIAAEKWSNVEVELQRRGDLVPNLVATVKASAKHEEDTLAKVAEARSQAAQIKLTGDDLSDPAKMAAFEKAQDQLKGALSRLMVVQEQYPDLKANRSFHDLQIQLEGTENRIQRARQEYNASARDYNATLLKISGQVVNKATGNPFKPRVFFQAAPESMAAPKVSF